MSFKMRPIPSATDDVEFYLKQDAADVDLMAQRRGGEPVLVAWICPSGRLSLNTSSPSALRALGLIMEGRRISVYTGD